MLKIKKNEKITIAKIITNEKCEDLNIELSEENSSINLLILVISKPGQIQKLENKITLKGKNSSANIMIKSLLNENCEIDLKNNIKICREAKNSTVVLEQKNLQLSGNFSISTLPALEIENDNCQARHSAQFSEIDKETLYYLASKKIFKKKAEKMLIKSFLLKDNEKFLDKKENKMFNKEISKLKI